MSALDRLHSLLDGGYAISTSLIADAYPLVHAGRAVTRGAVTQRMRNRGQKPVSRTSESMWAPQSVRVAFPEFARVEFFGTHV